MDINKMQNKKTIIFMILILIGLFCLANSNNNPNAFIQRIFRPIHIGSATFYYAGLFPLLLIYYSLKNIYEEKEYKFLSTTFKRILVMILLLSILPTCTQSSVKLCKSFYKDLNSIYCYRDNMKLSVSTTKENRELVCKLDLENCSNKSEEFNVKVKLPSFLKGINESTITNKEDLFILHANERRQFEIILNESSVKSGSVYFTDNNDFEFILFNNLHEVKFSRKD